MCHNDGECVIAVLNRNPHGGSIKRIHPSNRHMPNQRHPVFVIMPCLCVALLWEPAGLEARVNVVTLPGRDTVQLTIYNSADLTLVKETRVLTMRAGVNRLEFSWANTLIDPTSVEFRPLTHAAEVDVLDVSFPPRVTNTLEWRIKSEFAGEVAVEIRYFTSGISWSADYVVETDRTEKAMQLAGHVRVNNHSGEDYENAQIRLVVGVIRLVENIADLAQRQQHEWSETASNGKKMPEQKALQLSSSLSRTERTFAIAMDKLEKEVVKEALGEYFLYTVEGRDTIPTGWGKRLPSFKAPGVPIISFYKFEAERWGDSVMRYYKFTNSIPSKLGREPLPDGSVQAFRTVTDDHLSAFTGSTSVKYIPIGESVKLELGADMEVLVRPILMDWVKTDLRYDPNGNVTGWTTRETWEIEVQNSKDIDVVVDIRRSLTGDWSIRTDAGYEKVDAGKVKFVRPLKPRQKLRFAYEVTTRLGTNATK